MTTVFLVSTKSPTRRVVAVEAELVCRKFGWAMVKGRRFLLGSTAFFSVAAAHRCKLACLLKQAKAVKFLQYMYPRLAESILAQLADRKHPGWTVRR